MRFSLSLRNAVLSALMCLPLPVYAQTEDQQESWYQVELLVFKRHQSSATHEVWPKNIALAYPPNVQYLRDPASEPAQPEGVADSELDANQEASSGLPTSPDIAVTESDAPPIEPQEEPFVLLPKDAMFIRGAEYAINRDRALAPLFHATWAQPMKALKDAPAIVIRGGESFGNHHELEGTITLSVSRYLHLHTDLWLAEYETNYGQADYHWPPIPLPPEPESLEPTTTSDLSLGNLPLDADFNLSTGRSEGINGINLQVGDATEFNPASAAVTGLDSTLLSMADQPFLVKHIVKLDQKRRMRSNELHYIDHPELGIIIKIMPYVPSHQETEQTSPS
ncbi:CsiV family protein [Teredinibacter turnerae]|uniref:CsiV family protein n=1 Tax=Teredinibacter turnerae TaxID=2426 RepID=UPI0003797133|nr:CsiV family protein [Teredinibacter turnerae]